MDVHGAPRKLRALPTWLIGHLGLEARKVVNDAFVGLDTSRGDYAVLATLAEFGPLAQRELAQRSGQDQSDAVRLLDALQERRLIERTQDPADRRRNLISLTRSGSAELSRLDDALLSAQRALLAPLTAHERRQFVRLLQRLLGITN